MSWCHPSWHKTTFHQGERCAGNSLKIDLCPSLKTWSNTHFTIAGLCFIRLYGLDPSTHAPAVQRAYCRCKVDLGISVKIKIARIVHCLYDRIAEIFLLVSSNDILGQSHFSNRQRDVFILALSATSPQNSSQFIWSSSLRTRISRELDDQALQNLFPAYMALFYFISDLELDPCFKLSSRRLVVASWSSHGRGPKKWREIQKIRSSQKLHTDHN